ncbi:MAG: adenylyltransferase/cytidyltransferase family protein [candidate division KSB1 bacterium]|nr:adenylyltransferase/cytidyltransferase family protein [candidate division KSB1 bacterium]MDZ7334705.1 adenylyltransferase/cytidyltransferase family protein [candidate division KSB1 bacterium]MDZ7356209.1 adenylyltransferase/cytidyltransferase family protein [candidate division KSB1 bacterium]MDZ7400352.1 adenylyltransferase/cytidyltransferase family protein [candidate division KSB1 bacterium]
MANKDDNGKYKRTAIIGGTFNALHAGHKYYIKLAFDFADEVFILLTADEYARICKSYEVNPYSTRATMLRDYVVQIAEKKNFHIIKMDSEAFLINFCTANDFTMAVIIPEYYSLFQRINNIRVDEGKFPLLLLITQRIRTTEGFNISSTLIHNLQHDRRINPKQYSPDLAQYFEEQNHPNRITNIIPR